MRMLEGWICTYLLTFHAILVCDVSPCLCFGMWILIRDKLKLDLKFKLVRNSLQTRGGCKCYCDYTIGKKLIPLNPQIETDKPEI